jgi:transcriptional regulator with XRE-family HTH domain
MKRQYRNVKYAKEFARRLNMRMEELNLSQTRLAGISGVSQELISNYLHGKSVPRADIAVKLAFGLAMPVGDLIDFIVD